MTLIKMGQGKRVRDRKHRKGRTVGTYLQIGSAPPPNPPPGCSRSESRSFQRGLGYFRKKKTIKAGGSSGVKNVTFKKFNVPPP